MPAEAPPKPKRRLHNTVQIGQRWRRDDGLVVLVAQIHRGDESIEAKPIAPMVPCRFPISFDDLRAHYEQLVSFR